METVDPSIVATFSFEDVKLTVKPEVEVAFKSNAASP